MDEALSFKTDLNLLFDTLFEKHKDGEVSIQEIEKFFPQEVKERCKEEN